MKIEIEKLQDLVKKSLNYYGYNDKEVEQISKVLMYAQLRGNNQGVVKLIGKGLPNKASGAIEIDRETPVSALINGNMNQAMIVLAKATDIAIQKAKSQGAGIVGTFNTASSSGAIGYYANEIAKAGLIGFVYAGSPETVTTQGSYQPLFGTNPLAIGVPSNDEPIVLDMATSAMAYFGLVQAKTAGETIPENVAYDCEGNITTDPAKAMDGAILPFDRSYKGAGLAMMVEILTGPFVKAGFSGKNSDTNWGNLVYAINPELFGELNDFKNDVSILAGNVRNAKKLDGVDRIYTPGERGNSILAANLKEDSIEIEDNLYAQLIKVAEQMN